VGVEGAARATATPVAAEGAASDEREPSRPGAVGTPTWDEAAERYAGTVSRMAFSLTGDPDEACDLTQDVFVRVCRNLDRYRPGTFEAGSTGSPGAWAWTVSVAEHAFG
jgi:DNA-directed RNA polymerase specialized sigma24 family protein